MAPYAIASKNGRLNTTSVEQRLTLHRFLMSSLGTPHPLLLPKPDIDVTLRSRYLSSATYLSSRAFPSTILSPNPSLQSSPSSEPILLPGVDSLNHARGHPVSWLADYQSSSGPRISLVIHSDIPASAELSNNYGLKPNSELILGYGFSLPQNPDDTIVLQLGHSRTKWEVGRDAKGMDGLWEEILARMVMAGGGTEVTYEEVLDASSMLMEMNTDLMDKLPVLGGSSPAGVREEVYTMWSHYIEGMCNANFLFVRLTQSQVNTASFVLFMSMPKPRRKKQ